MRSLRLCILVAAYIIFATSAGSAKVYWLPDFMGKNVDRSSAGKQPDIAECPSGWQKSGANCARSQYFPGVGICYTNCETAACAAVTGLDCGSFGCAQTYASCPSKCEICYTDNCLNREDADAPYGCMEYWEDCPEKCKIPYPDNCHGLEDVDAPYGCQTYWDGCPSKCKTPFPDNCRNREDNITDYGCQKYWQDCPDKCEIGKTCTPTDCSGFTLTAAPANASYTTCTPGCGNSAVYYKFTACKRGFWDLTNFICEGNKLCTWNID